MLRASIRRRAGPSWRQFLQAQSAVTNVDTLKIC